MASAWRLQSTISRWREITSPIGAQICGPVLADPMCLRFARWLENEYRAFQPPPLALEG